MGGERKGRSVQPTEQAVGVVSPTMRLLAAALVLTSFAHAEVPALTPPPGARLMIGLEAGLDGVAVSPTGTVLAVASGKDGLQLIDVATGRGITRRADLVCKEKDERYATCAPQMAFAPDGKRLAVWWPELTKLVVVAVPSAKTEFQANVATFSTLMFLEDGRLLADDVYDASGKRHALAHPKYFSNVSPDGTRFVDLNKRVVDAGGKVLAEAPPGAQVFDVLLGRDPNVFVASRGAGYPDIVTWRAGERTARTLVASSPQDSNQQVHGFAFPPPYDRVFVALGSSLISVRLDGERVFRSDWITRAQLGRGAVAATPAKGLVAIAYRCPYHVDANGDLIPGRIFCAARPSRLVFDEHGEQLVAIPWDGSGLMTFDTKTGALVAARLQPLALPISGALAAVAKDPTLAKKVELAFAKSGVKPGTYDLSPDGRYLFVGGLFRDNAIIDLTTNRARTGLPDFVVSGDGKRIAVRHKDDEKLVDVRTVEGDRLIRTLTTPATLPERSALSYDGSVFAAEGTGTVAVIDVATGRSLFDAPCRGSYTGHVELSRDGRLLACDTGEATRVYDVRAKKLVKQLKHPWSDADTFALSSDGRQLAIAAENIVIVDLK